MPFKKGQSGNPGGKPKSNYRIMLEKALASDTKTHRQSLLRFAVAKARTDSTVLNAILKKILPDLKSIEAKLDTESPFRLILEYAPTAKTPKADKQGKQSSVKATKTLIDLARECTNPDGHDWRPHKHKDDSIYWQCANCAAIGKPPKTDNPERPGSGNGRIHSR